MVPNADRLGLVADPRGAAVGAEGVVPGLWAVGGVLRPRDFEATAVPELARQALTGRDGFSALPGEPANGSTDAPTESPWHALCSSLGRQPNTWSHVCPCPCSGYRDDHRFSDDSAPAGARARYDCDLPTTPATDSLQFTNQGSDASFSRPQTEARIHASTWTSGTDLPDVP